MSVFCCIFPSFCRQTCMHHISCTILAALAKGGFFFFGVCFLCTYKVDFFFLYVFFLFIIPFTSTNRYGNVEPFFFGERCIDICMDRLERHRIIFLFSLIQFSFFSYLIIFLFLLQRRKLTRPQQQWRQRRNAQNVGASHGWCVTKLVNICYDLFVVYYNLFVVYN